MSLLQITRKKTHLLPIATLVSIVTIFVTALLMLPIYKNQAQAASGNDWVAGNIISDSEFTNANSMSVSDIQAFLNEKIGTCDTWGTGQASEFRYNGTRAQYAAAAGWPAPPYTCLNLYYEVPKVVVGGSMPANNYSSPSSRPAGAQSAAWIIKDAANRYGISPKVLLVKIATESVGPLTSDRWPLFYQYKYAMGAQCPDSGPGGSANCNPAYAGFSIQMYEAARLMRTYLDNMDQPWYGYVENGRKTQNPANRCGQPGAGEGVKVPNTTNCILWNVKPRGCGAQNIHIESKATAALYTYTPYQPNRAALNNMYGTGDNCSAYGNRNFWSLYWDWFGNTRGGINIISQVQKRYDELGGINGFLGRAIDGGYCDHKTATCWQGFAGGVLISNPSAGTWESKGGIRGRWAQLGYQTGKMGLPTSSEVWDGRGWWQNYQNGAIIGTTATKFWESAGPIRERWAKLNYQSGFMGYPTSPITTTSATSAWQSYEKGTFVWGASTGAWETLGAIRERWGRTNYEHGFLGYPTTGEVLAGGGGKYQQFQKGRIYWSPATGAALSVHGAILDRYLQTGGSTGFLGYPTTGEVLAGGGGKYQQFQKGRIYWNESTGAWSIHGAILDRYLQLGGSIGALGYPSSGESTASGVTTQQFKNGLIRWSPTSGILK